MPRRLFSPQGAALVSLLLGGALTFFVAWEGDARARDEVAMRFRRYAVEVREELTRRVMLPEYGLRGTRALVDVNGGIDASAFRRYVQARDIEHEFPGVRGFGWMELVPRADVASFESHARSEQGGGFRVHGIRQEDATDLLIVKYVEPLARNAGAWGLAGGPPARRAAAERAIASGVATLSAPFVLAQDERRGLGWLLYLPVYRGGGIPSTAQERRARLLGLLYAPIPIAEVLAPLRDVGGGEVEFQLFEGFADTGQLLFDSRTGSAAVPRAGRSTAPGLEEFQRITMGDRMFSLRVASAPKMEADLQRHGAVVVIGAGTVLSVLLALGLGTALRLRDRAEAQGARLSADVRRLAGVVRRTSSAVAELDADLQVRWVNDGFCHATGLPPEACTGRAVESLLQAPQGEDLRALLLAAVHADANARMELLHVAPDGARRWLDTEVQADWGADGTLAGVTLIALDVTARRVAEQALGEREHLIRLMIDSIPARLSYWDREERCVLANRKVAEAYGRTPEEMIGMHLADLFAPRRYEVIHDHVAAALRGESRDVETVLAAPGDRRETSLVHYAPDVADGEVQGFFVLAMDITALKEAQEAAQQASAAKTQFLSNISHEIRTPMNAVIGMLTLLRRTALDPRQADYAAKADTAAHSLLSLLNDVLDFSRIEAGKMTLDPRPFSFRTLLHDLEVILAPNVGNRPIALRFELDPEVPGWLLGDDMRLRQILINLGGNAIKFTREGEVRVRVALQQLAAGKALVDVSVSDTGIGIAPQDQQRIFSDFSQASASTTREFGGSGLGLAICNRLAGLMGTQLELESVPGQGSRFHFRLRLPLAEPPTAASAHEDACDEPSADALPLAGRRLLVAEDNAVNQQVARELLQAAGAQVTIAANGREAVLAVAREAPFDAVLMDMQMPVLDGLGATRDIRERLGQTELPIIAMTANALDSDREQCLAAGMDDHVAKPFSPASLVATLLRHLGEGGSAPHEEPPPAPGDAVLDRHGAIAMLGGEEELYAQLLPMFRRDLDRALQALPRIAERSMDAADATRLLHSVKGTALTVGARRVGEAAAAAERASLEQEGRVDARLLDALRRAIDELLPVLDGAVAPSDAR